MNKEQSLERLKLIRDWKQNWDGEGADAPDHEILNTTQKLIVCLPNNVQFSLDLNADSQPTLYVKRNQAFSGSGNQDFTITVESKDKISFCWAIDYRLVDDYCDYDLDFDGINLPPSLELAMDKFTQESI